MAKDILYFYPVEVYKGKVHAKGPHYYEEGSGSPNDSWLQIRFDVGSFVVKAGTYYKLRESHNEVSLKLAYRVAKEHNNRTLRVRRVLEHRLNELATWILQGSSFT